VAAGLFHSDRQIWTFGNGETKARARAPEGARSVKHCPCL